MEEEQYQRRRGVAGADRESGIPAERAASTDQAEELLTVMAHDLRNYLTPLKARLDLLERQARRDPAPQRSSRDPPL